MTKPEPVMSHAAKAAQFYQVYSLLPHSQKRSTDALPSARVRALIVTSVLSLSLSL